jgi:hypothetical protein
MSMVEQLKWKGLPSTMDPSRGPVDLDGLGEVEGQVMVWAKDEHVPCHISFLPHLLKWPNVVYMDYGLVIGIRKASFAYLATEIVQEL